MRRWTIIITFKNTEKVISWDIKKFEFKKSGEDGCIRFYKKNYLKSERERYQKVFISKKNGKWSTF